jgi:hypothetical protein
MYMRVIKLYEDFNNKEDIIKLCFKYNIRNYTINPDGTIDVNGNVNIGNSNLNNIPLKFNKVNGYFDCSENNLTTLEGSPNEVGGSFNCNENILVNLKGAPKYVSGEFDCNDNLLVSLEGCPDKIGGDFYCSYNDLRTLEGITLNIGGIIHAYNSHVHEVWSLINDMDYLEIFLDYDMIDGKNLYLVRLNDILSMMGKEHVTEVKGYKCI